MLINDLAFYRLDDVPAGIACWSSAEPDHPISIIIEPEGPVDEATQERVAAIVGRFPAVLSDAKRWLTDALTDESWQLSAEERAALADATFDEPEVVVWSGEEWMVRFASSALAMAEEWGIGVRYEGDVAVAVEDLSDTDEDEDD